MSRRRRAEVDDDQLDDLKQAFRLFDQDGDGVIDGDEFKEVLETLRLEPTALEIQALMAELDDDKNGTIEFDEFLTLMIQKLKDVDKEDEIREAFRVFDKDGDGNLSAEELLATMKDLGEELTLDEVQEMVNEADLDGDGEVSFEEFRKMMIRE